MTCQNLVSEIITPNCVQYPYRLTCQGVFLLSPFIAWPFLPTKTKTSEDAVINFKMTIPCNNMLNSI